MAALAVATLSCLASCSTWTTPYDRLDKDGYTVSVKFDVGEGATFANVANVSIVDVFNMEDFEINFYRECNPPFFPSHLAHQEEKDRLWTLEKELEYAIQNEDIVDLNLLDKEYFSEKLDIKEIEKIQEKRNLHR